MFYSVYILYSRKYKKTYTGITNDLNRRLKQHNNKQNFYTKRYIPWEVIFTENFKTRIKARQREKYLKSAAGRRWIKRNLFS